MKCDSMNVLLSNRTLPLPNNHIYPVKVKCSVVLSSFSALAFHGMVGINGIEALLFINITLMTWKIYMNVRTRISIMNAIQ